MKVFILISFLCFGLLSFKYFAYAQCDSNYCENKWHQDIENDEMLEENPYTSNIADHGKIRYLLYDVNFNEGFNLRLDVYVRMVHLVKQLGSNWILVLPEWTDLPHWSNIPNKKVEQSKRWSTYFDFACLSQFVRVLEMHQFLELFTDQPKVQIDTVLSLENFDTIEEESFEEKYEFYPSNCTRDFEAFDGKIEFRYDTNFVDKFEYKSLFEVRIEGFDSTLSQVIRNHFDWTQIILVSNAEVVLHSNYGNHIYWKIRQSLRISSQLKQKADEYREVILNSNDTKDKTSLGDSCSNVEKVKGEAQGGPYLAVHLRRQDFVEYYADRIPSLECAVTQIVFAATRILTPSFEKIYIATDATTEEYKLIAQLLNQSNLQVYRYEPSDGDLPGEVALIDQWIASHARLFVGTHESTFTLKIMEQREIFGFYPNTTFNVFCPDCDLHLMLRLCKPNSQWRIVY